MKRQFIHQKRDLLPFFRQWMGIVVFFIFAIIAPTIYAQQFSTEIDKKDVQIGEPFRLIYKVTLPNLLDEVAYHSKKEEFEGYVVEGSLEKLRYSLEVVSFKDTSYTSDNENIWQGVYQLIGWDSAYVIIPPEAIKIGEKHFQFEPEMIAITSPDLIEGKPLYDIYESFTELPLPSRILLFLKKNAWWLFALLLGIVLLLRKLTREEVKESAPIGLLPATLLNIDELEKEQRYLQNLKEYYFQLSQIIRQFLELHYEERLMDKTSFEISEFLQANKVEKTLIEQVNILLKQSDMVKFAKSEPSLEEIQKVTENARNALKRLAQFKKNQLGE